MSPTCGVPVGEGQKRTRTAPARAPSSVVLAAEVSVMMGPAYRAGRRSSGGRARRTAGPGFRAAASGLGDRAVWAWSGALPYLLRNVLETLDVVGPPPLVTVGQVAGTGAEARRPVDLFAEDVRVASVAGSLGDDVDEDPVQCHGVRLPPGHVAR